MEIAVLGTGIQFVSEKLALEHLQEAPSLEESPLQAGRVKLANFME